METISGVVTPFENIKNDHNLCLNLFVLMYADDTIFLSENPEYLKYFLDMFFPKYCKNWNLKGNLKKYKTFPTRDS